MDLQVVADVLGTSDARTAIVRAALETRDPGVIAATEAWFARTLPPESAALASLKARHISAMRDAPMRRAVVLELVPVGPGSRGAVPGLPGHLIEPSVTIAPLSTGNVRIIAPFAAGATGSPELARPVGEWWSAHGARGLMPGAAAKLEALLASDETEVRL